MNDDEIKSLREWLASWDDGPGDGPNWSDSESHTVPIAKFCITRLLDDHERLVKCLQWARQQLLDHRGNMTMLFKANILTAIQQSLDGTVSTQRW